MLKQEGAQKSGLRLFSHGETEAQMCKTDAPRAGRTPVPKESRASPSVMLPVSALVNRFVTLLILKSPDSSQLQLAPEAKSYKKSL